MIKSMTAYGKEIILLSDKKINIEIKSLNSKGLDLNMRLPGLYREYELGFRKQIAESVERGKVDFGIFVEKTGTDLATQLNKEVIQAYMAQFTEISKLVSQEKALEMALRLPDTMNTAREEVDETELDLIKQGIVAALANFNTFREEEGKALATDFNQRINTIESLLEKAKEIDLERLAAVRTRLEKSVADLQVEVDQNRFEQELIYYLEKYDITEEKVRLANHLSYFKKTMGGVSAGKKLGFIAQEIGREINTMGSKANDANLQKIVVQMKDELEKIKEQLLNVL